MLQRLVRSQAASASRVFLAATNARRLHTARHLQAIKPYNLADIGEGIKECEVIQWFVEPGAKIEEFDPICEVQSDKASVEITSRYNGVIKKLHYDPGQMALVGQPLCDIDIPENELPDEQQESTPDASAEASQEQVPEDIEQPQEPQAKPQSKFQTLATPAVRRVSRELNIDLSQVHGTGKDGRILKEDVLNYSKTGSTPQQSQSEPQARPEPAGAAAETVAPLTPIQKQMFKTMTNSLSIPHFLYTDEVQMDALAKMRAGMNEQLASSNEGLTKMSFMPFFIKALSLSLQQHPLLNSKVAFENDKPVLVTRPQHNIGIAMDTPQGLIVPNIKNVESKGLIEIGRELQRLTELGRDGKLTAAELKGGTITLSNIGTVGGTYVAPVIVDTEVAIGGLGKARKLPRFDAHMNVVPRTIMNMSWSGDHRVVDGMSMARMVDLWKSFVEQPEKMMMYMK